MRLKAWKDNVCISYEWLRGVQSLAHKQYTLLDSPCQASLWYEPLKRRSAPLTQWWVLPGSLRPLCRYFSSASPGQTLWKSTATSDVWKTSPTNDLIRLPLAPHIKLFCSLTCKIKFIKRPDCVWERKDRKTRSWHHLRDYKHALLWWKQCNDKVGGNNAPNFGWHVEHQGHNRRVVVAIEDEAHFMELSAEVGSILRELTEAISTWKRLKKNPKLK